MNQKSLVGFISSLLLLVNTGKAATITLFWSDPGAPGLATGFISRSGIVGSISTNRIDHGTNPPLEVVWTNLPTGGYFWFSVESTNNSGSGYSTNFFTSAPAPVQQLTKPTPTSLRWVDTNTAPDITAYALYSGIGSATNQTVLSFSQVTRTGANGNRVVLYTNFTASVDWAYVTAKNLQGLESDVSQLILLPMAPVGLGVR